MALIVGTVKSDDLVGTEDDDLILALAGSDYVYGDDDKVFLSVSASSSTEDTVYSDPLVISSFGNDIIQTGLGSDVAYGDAGAVSLNFLGASNVAAGDSATVTVNSVHLAFGVDTIVDTGGGHNSIYGDVGSLKISALSGTGNGLNANANLYIKSLTMIFGDDLLVTANGNDYIVGDAGVLSIEAKAQPSPTGASQQVILGKYVDDVAQRDIWQFGDDYISSGEGNDILIGDIDKHDVVVRNADNSGLGDHIAVYSVWELGNDYLKADGGNDYMVGDIKVLNITVENGDNAKNIAGYDAAGLGIEKRPVFEIIYKFGDDYMEGGAGNDTMIGDVDSYNALMRGAESPDASFVGITTLSNLFFKGPPAPVFGSYRGKIYGDDEMYGGDGNDVMVGDLKNWNLDIKAGDHIYGGPGVMTCVTYIAGADFGDDLMDGGAGNDTIIGDAMYVDMDMRGGDNAGVGFSTYLNPNSPGGILLSGFQLPAQAFGIVDFQPIEFGHDTIYGRSGNDTISGDVLEYSFYAKAGDNLNDINNAGATAGVGARAAAGFINGSSLVFGNDYVEGGDGNDVIYGEGKLWDFDAIGGTGEMLYSNLYAIGNSFEAEAGFINASLIFGDDTLKGGSGNDQLFGDWDTASYYMKDGFIEGGVEGVTSLAEAYIGLSKPAALVSIPQDQLAHKFGDDHLIGGDGDDLLVGDVYNLSFVHLDSNGVNKGVTLDTDPNVLNFAWGNDILDGGRGNDTLIGNGGNDQFLFDIGTSFGHDIVVDYDDADDLLVFNNSADPSYDLADLQAEAVLSNNGVDTTITLSSGSVVLKNIVATDLDDLNVSVV